MIINISPKIGKKGILWILSLFFIVKNVHPVFSVDFEENHACVNEDEIDDYGVSKLIYSTESCIEVFGKCFSNI
jgi:hypothetical protein